MPMQRLAQDKLECLLPTRSSKRPTRGRPQTPRTAQTRMEREAATVGEPAAEPVVAVPEVEAVPEAVLPAAVAADEAGADDAEPDEAVVSYEAEPTSLCPTLPVPKPTWC